MKKKNKCEQVYVWNKNGKENVRIKQNVNYCVHVCKKSHFVFIALNKIPSSMYSIPRLIFYFIFWFISLHPPTALPRPYQYHNMYTILHTRLYTPHTFERTTHFLKVSRVSFLGF